MEEVRYNSLFLNSSSHIGRARAWLRLALMQKKLADYFKVLVDHRDDALREFYEPIALMISDDAVILSGILLGLNAIDCNFCLKVTSYPIPGPDSIIMKIEVKKSDSLWMFRRRSWTAS